MSGCASTCVGAVSNWCIAVFACVRSPVWLCCTNFKLKKPREAIVTAISNIFLYFYCILCILLYLQDILISFFPFKNQLVLLGNFSTRINKHSAYLTCF